MALRHIEGDPDLKDVLPTLHEQNFSGDSKWTLEKIRSDCRLAFKKGKRGGTRTTLIIGCSPDLRTALVQKGRL